MLDDVERAQLSARGAYAKVTSHFFAPRPPTSVLGILYVGIPNPRTVAVCRRVSGRRVASPGGDRPTPRGVEGGVGPPSPPWLASGQLGVAPSPSAAAGQPGPSTCHLARRSRAAGGIPGSRDHARRIRGGRAARRPRDACMPLAPRRRRRRLPGGRGGAAPATAALATAVPRPRPGRHGWPRGRASDP